MEMVMCMVVAIVGLVVLVPLGIWALDHLSGEATLREGVRTMLGELDSREQTELKGVETAKERSAVRSKYDAWRLQVRAVAYYD